MRPFCNISVGPPSSVLFTRRRHSVVVLSRREKLDLGFLGITSTQSVRTFDTARIHGVHFKVNEWGRRTCGSVVTTIYGGKSRYCIVKRFLRVQHKSFVSVIWLSPPEYPYNPVRIVVRVHLQRVQSAHRCIIPVDRIEPCSVGVIPDVDGVHYWMLRTKGSDRVHVRF